MARKKKIAPSPPDIQMPDLPPEQANAESSANIEMPPPHAEIPPAPERAQESPLRPNPTAQRNKRALKKIGIAVIIILALLGAARIFHWWNWGLSAQEIQQREVVSLVQKVGKLMILPHGETPVVATVTNAQLLKQSQPFYQDAQNGDVLMIYSQAQRAILYRPGTDMIINVGPIYVNKTGSATTTASQ